MAFGVQAFPAAAPQQQLNPLTGVLHPGAAQNSAPLAPRLPACSNLGTEITFLHHPPDAFRQAARENKLVLMVHLSGNFEDQAFT